ncbi:FMRFamide receptor [Lamellibrachia satsuma]|nr:FMRFamide receptor [Lamellibrachia satsuma]
MNSTTTWDTGGATNNYSTEMEGDKSFTSITGIWVTGVCCILGLAGNILSFIVLFQAFKKSTMFLVLRAVIVSDIVFLLTVFITMTLVNVFPYTGMLQTLNESRGYVQFILWPILMMSQMTTVWLTVFVSVERYIAICFPLKVASLCTMSKVRCTIIGIFCMSVLFNIPRYFEYEYAKADLNNKTSLGHSAVYRYLYTCTLYSLFLFLLPLSLLIFLNGKLILALRRGRRMWRTLQVRQRKEQNLTTIPLAIVVVFFICATPALGVNVIDAMHPNLGNSPDFIMFLVIANLLVVLNSATNFIIYCLLGTKFRTRLLQLCHLTWCQTTSYKQVAKHPKEATSV